MLEFCLKIEECERILSGELGKIRLLGDIPLNEYDVKKLEELFKNELVGGNEKGLDNLLINNPVSIAIYLVWKGIISYEGGEYWSGLKDILGIYSANEEIRVGEFFLEFLKRNKLFYLNIEGSNKYVTPILLHGRIPNYCIKEYFKEILLKFIRRYADYALDETDIRQELQIQKENYLEREKINNKTRRLNEKNNQLNIEIGNLDGALGVRENVKKIKGLIDKIEDIDEYMELPENFDVFREEINREIRNLKNMINIKKERKRKEFEILRNLEEKNILLINKPEKLKQFEEAIKDISILENKIEKLVKEKKDICKNIEEKIKNIFTEPLREKTIKSINKINFERIEKNVNEINKKRALIKAKEKIIDQEELKERELWKWKHWIVEIGLILIGLMLMESNVSLIVGLGTIFIGAIGLFRNVNKSNKIKRQNVNLEKEIIMERSIIAEKEKSIKDELGDFSIGEDLFYPDYYEDWKRLFEVKPILATNSELERKWNLLRDKVNIKKLEVIKEARELGLAADEPSINFEEYLEERKKEEETLLRKIYKIKSGLEKIHIDEIREIEIKIDRIEKKYREIENRYKRLGNGDFLAGIKKVDAKRRMIQEIGELKERIRASWPEVETIEEIVELSERHFGDIIERKKQTEEELRKTEKEIEALKREYETYENDFDYVDKPIRRFLIYGSDIAENFLIESIMLIINNAETEKNVIPERIKKELLKLRKNIKDKDLPKKKKKMRHPYLYFDGGLNGLFIKIPKQRIEFRNEVKTIRIKIYDKSDNRAICQRNLKAYVVEKNIIKINEEDRKSVV